MTAARLRGLLIDGRPDAWRRLGFEVDDDRFQTGGVTVALTGRAGGGIRAWHVEGVEPIDVEGLGHEPIAAGGQASHPNGVIAVDHVVASTSDLDRTTTELERAGYVARRTVEGVAGREGRRFRFFLLGTSVLELIGPATPRGDRPARFAGLAFATERLQQLSDELGPLLGEVHDAVQAGRRIASVREDRAGVGLPVAFMTPR